MVFKSILFIAALGLSAPVLAQQPAPEGAGAPPAYLTDTAADLDAILDARIAALKTVLVLTPEQEGLWAPVESALRANAAAARLREEARYGLQQPTDFLQVLTRIQTAEAERGEGITAFVKAFTPLAAKLSDDQMRRVPPFLGMIDFPYGEQPSAQLWIVED